MVHLVRLILVACLLFSIPAQAKDVRELAERLEAKAMNGDVRSAYKLGLLFSNGKKVDPDFYTAAEWFERAAEQGYVKAMLKLADLYFKGKGVDVDIEKAQLWNEKAAKSGSRKAMVTLGDLFVVKNDFQQSAYWYQKAAVKGEAVAMRELGKYYLNGTGVRFDLSYAYAWLELAIQKGDYKAKSLQAGIVGNKGQAWADRMKNKMENRMIPKLYWDLH